jgi:RimJ/RimL family protein N-acetyltransferase
MRPFMEKAMAAYKELHPDAKIWAIIDSKNASSIALSERLGFAIAPQEDQAFTLMTLA